MACGIFRRYSKGRRFLYEEELQKLIDSEEGTKRRIISAIPIDDNYRVSLAKEPNLKETFTSLRQFSSGVCRIEVNEGSGLGYSGSGFHFGGGWILTSAHVLRNRDKVDKARFVFFLPEREISFEAKPRRALLHRLLPAGRRLDYHNRDIALVKLGIQFSHGRRKSDLEEWETDEQQLLEHYNLFDFTHLANRAFTPNGEVQFSTRSKNPITAIHFGGQNGHKKFAFNIAIHEVYKHGQFRVVNFAYSVNGGVSGCPVLQLIQDEWFLIGVVFGGVSYDVGSNFSNTGQCLLWNQQVIQHLEAGRDTVAKMSAFKSYDLLVPFPERGELLNNKAVKQAADLAVQHAILIL